MWIITDGVDMAVSKMIGEAIKEERARRECKQLQLSHLGQEKVQRFQKLTLIGVVPKNVITYSDLFQGNVSIQETVQYVISLISRGEGVIIKPSMPSNYINIVFLNTGSVKSKFMCHLTMLGIPFSFSCIFKNWYCVSMIAWEEKF